MLKNNESFPLSYLMVYLNPLVKHAAQFKPVMPTPTGSGVTHTAPLAPGDWRRVNAFTGS